AGDAGTPGMTHHGDAVLLGPRHLRKSVRGICELTETELRQMHTRCLQVSEILLLQGRLEHDGTCMHRHSVGMEVVEALLRRDGERFHTGRGARAPRCVDLPRRHDTRDPPVHVAGEKVDSLLAWSVVTEYDVAVRVDQSGRDSRADGVDDVLRGIDFAPQIGLRTDSGDRAVA